MNRKILITGGLGNLGYWLTQHFCHEHDNVYVLSRQKEKPDDGLIYTLISADLENLSELRGALHAEFEYCIHLAGAHDYFEKDYFAKAVTANVLGTRNLIDVLSSNAALKHFIYFSTFHVYGRESGNIDETVLPEPKNDYAATHHFCELYLKQFWQTKAFPSTIIRLSNGYGHPVGSKFTKWYLVLNDFAKSVFERQEIVINSNGLGLRDFVWHGDVCTATDRLMDLEPGCEVFNVASGSCHRIIDIAKIVCEAYENRYKTKPKIIVKGTDTNAPAALTVNIDKVIKAVGFASTDKMANEINAVFDYLERANGDG